MRKFTINRYLPRFFQVKGLRYILLFGYRGVRYFFLLNFRRHRLIQFRIPGVQSLLHLRNDTSDIAAFYQIFNRRDYDISFPFIPRTIVDLGGNIGLSSVFFKSRFPDAKIIVVEPDRENFSVLKKNLQSYEDIICINSAIWNKRTRLALNRNNLDHWSIYVSETESNTFDTIEALTMADMMTKHGLDRIDFLKVDIEGAELELFENGFEDWLPKVRLLAIELHEHTRPGCCKSFFSALSRYQFKISVNGEFLICHFYEHT